MEWPLAGEPVKDRLAEPQHLLVERASADALPWCNTIISSGEHVQKEAHVLDHPRYHGVVDRNVLAYHGIKA
jgi:hypothetical protein